MSTARKEKKGLVEPVKTRPMTADELDQLQQLIRIVEIDKFKVAQIKANTALVPRGQEVAAELEATARLMENFKNQWLAETFKEMGYPVGAALSVNPQTGEVSYAS